MCCKDRQPRIPLTIIAKYNIDKGASFLEFVIVFPVLILLIIGIVDFARYSSVQGLLNKGANRGLSIAETVPGLEFAEDPSNEEYQNAVAEIREAVTRHAVRQIVSATEGDGMAYLTAEPQIVLPTPKAGETMEQALQEHPIEVQVDGIVDFILPGLPTVPVQGKAVGFREPRYVVSNPIPVDCVGNPLGSANYNLWCPCEDTGDIWDDGTNSCVCNTAGGFTQNGQDCSCAAPRVITGERCACQPGSTTCPNNQAPVLTNQQTCTYACRCPNNQIMDASGTCRCPDNRQMNAAGWCSCTQNCPRGLYNIEGRDCACGCPSGYTMLNGTCVPIGCDLSRCQVIAGSCTNCKE